MRGGGDDEEFTQLQTVLPMTDVGEDPGYPIETSKREKAATVYTTPAEEMTDLYFDSQVHHQMDM